MVEDSKPKTSSATEIPKTGRKCPNPECRFDANPQGQENCLRCGTLLGETCTTLGSSVPGTMREPTFGIRFPFGEVRIDGTLNIGRDPDFSPIATRIDGLDRVSRRHAEIRVTGDKLAVMDNGSMNGVLVNGRKIPSNTLCELRVGDEVSFSSQLKTIVTGVGS